MSQFIIRTMQKDLEALLPQEQKEAAPSLAVPVPKKSVSVLPARPDDFGRLGGPPEKLPMAMPKLPEIPKEILEEIPKPLQPKPIQPQAPPRPPRPPKKENEADVLLRQGWLLYKQKSYLEALEKFEKAAALPVSWWTKSKIRKAIGICRKQIVKIEKERQEEQKKLAAKLKEENERKLKQEREAELKTRQAEIRARQVEARAQKEAEEKVKEEKKRRQAEEKARLEAEKNKREVEEKARQEAEKQAEKEKREAEKKAKPAKPSKISFFKVAVSALVILVLISFIVYWINYKKVQPPVQPITPPPVKAELILPAALFYVESTETISIKAGQEADLPNLLEKIVRQEQQPGIFKRILVKQSNGDEKFLRLSELADALKINLPENFLEKAGNNYMFFLYGQKEVSSNPFYAGLGRNRFGLIIKITNPEETGKAMANWEKHMAEDLSPLFFNMAIPLVEKFQNGIYENFTIRYLHSPDKYLAINYALLENHLIVSFSQDSIHATIDRLLK